MEIHCAFDGGFSRFRFDRIEKIKGQEFGGKYVLTPEYGIEAAKGAATATMHKPDQPAPEHVAPFDVRTVGLINCYVLHVGMSTFGRESMFEFLQNMAYNLDTKEVIFQGEKIDLSMSELVEVADTGDGVTKLMWREVQPPHDLRAIWIDANQGFSPVERKDLAQRGDAISVRGAEEISWTQVSGVWVPARFTSHYDDMEWDLEFDWEQVNEPVSDVVFTEDGLELHGKAFVDNRLGTPILVKRIPKLAEESEPVSRMWIVLIAVGLTVAAAGLLLLRRRQAR